MQQSVSVELMKITKQYGRRKLFRDITQRVNPGECLAVTGRNGSGKSTLLKIIAGMIRPTAGVVKIYTDGQQIDGGERPSCCGMVSPEIIFYQTMTGYENVQFIARASGADLSTEHVLACFPTVGLSGRAHDLVSTYSTGMRQRLKFAVLAALNPPLWLLDEPSSNLDGAGKKLVADLIKTALTQHFTVIIATNEAEEAEYAGQEIALA